MRIYAAIAAALGWCALTLQLVLILLRAPLERWPSELIVFLSFFTILTNLLVTMVWTAVALQTAGFFRRPSVQAATAVYITVVAVAYHLLLRQLWNPQGAQLAADLLLHSAVPVAYLIYWFLFAPRAELLWKDAGRWLAYPAGYLAYTLARGAVSKEYPYPFLDVNTLGYGGVFLRAAIFLLIFLSLGLLLVAVGRVTRRRTLA